MKFFAIHGSDFLGHRVAAIGGFDLSPYKEQAFGHGDTVLRPTRDLKGHDVFVMQGPHGRSGDHPSDLANRMLRFVRSCRDAGARTVTVIDPYLAMRPPPYWADPDSPEGIEQHDLAQAVDHFVTLDSYRIDPQQSPFDCPTTNLSMCGTFARDVLNQADDAPFVILTSGTGKHRFLQSLRAAISKEAHLPVGLTQMNQITADSVQVDYANPDLLRGAAVLIVDDLLAEDDEMMRMAHLARACGAARVNAYATHNMLSDVSLCYAFISGELDSLTISDSTRATAFHIPPSQVRVLTCARLIADQVLDHSEQTLVQSDADDKSLRVDHRQ